VRELILERIAQNFGVTLTDIANQKTVASIENNDIFQESDAIRKAIWERRSGISILKQAPTLTTSNFSGYCGRNLMLLFLRRFDNSKNDA
jgi:hypothetical protein